ncbi:LOW QUALITY PROTEIN: Retroelement [Phytophthora megakarya]|uniref:Retroelement n=1 Tax=Phytophthora megakarya TaxID=4795 RepID=A0A225WJ55_9STRA|nr:LOW QUALITY PROTEIN: Retroelement [Phytophthora megakarya]
MSPYGGRVVGLVFHSSKSTLSTIIFQHLATETKKEFQGGYVNDPAFKQQWSKGTEKRKSDKNNGLLFFRQKKGETHVCRSRRISARILSWSFMMEQHQHIPEVDVLSMDFITGLPGYDAIFVVVDKLSKRLRYAPTYMTADAKDTANIFFEAVVRHH